MSASFLSVTLAWLVVAVLCALGERAPAGSRRALVGETALRTAVGLALAWGITAFLWYLFVVRRSIGSMDFFLHVCTARDMAAGPLADDDPVLAGYHLLPGIYQFWRAAFHMTGGSLSALQWVYVAVLLVHPALVGAIVGRATRSPVAGVFAGLWDAYLVCSLEAWQGFLEPVATLPALLGVLAWGGEPLRGRAGVLRALALGAGLGLALETTMKAGFLSLGALALLPGLRARDREQRHRVGVLVLVPVAAVAALLVGILAEGHGLLPLERAVDFVRRYRHLGAGFLENVRGLAQPDVAGQMLPAFAVGGAALWLFLVRVLRGVKVSQPRVALAGFGALAAFASLMTLTRRAYIHYLMLPAPFLVIASVVSFADRVPSVPARVRESRLARLALLGLAAVLLHGRADRPDRFSAWPPFLDARFKIKAWHEDLAGGVFGRDLAQIAGLLHAGENLLIVPPYRDEVHFLLGTRSEATSEGYFFEPFPGGQLATVLWDRDFSVLVLDHGGPDLEEQTRIHESTALIAALPSHGFHPVARLATMSLWRRDANRSAH